MYQGKCPLKVKAASMMMTMSTVECCLVFENMSAQPYAQYDYKYMERVHCVLFFI